MRCQIKLFLCYPLAPASLFIAALVGAFLSMVPILAFLACGLIVLAYYFLLISSLLGCSKMGGWPLFFYQLAMASACTNLASASLVFFPHSNLTERVPLLFGLTILGVYIACSLAGAAMAWGSGRKIQAAMQVLWPVLSILAPFLTARLLVVSLLVFGVQGLQAMLLGLSLHTCDTPVIQRPEDSEIGWET